MIQSLCHQVDAYGSAAFCSDCWRTSCVARFLIRFIRHPDLMASVIFPGKNNSLDKGNASHLALGSVEHVTPSRRGHIWYEHFLARNTAQILFDLMRTCTSTRLGDEDRIVTRLALSPVVHRRRTSNVLACWWSTIFLFSLTRYKRHELT
jgi:hypothetical protein